MGERRLCLITCLTGYHMNEQFNLDGLVMNAVETDPNGVIGIDTFFHFRQEGQYVNAEYSGGRVNKGYLVGIVKGDGLRFRYCQLESDASLNGGESKCDLERKDGLIRIVEHFQWESREGGGQNVLQEIAK